MITLEKLQDYLSRLLDVESFEDYCVNGLQIEGRPDIRKIVTGVSVSLRLFETAVERNADAVLVHHGLFWKNTQHPLTLTGFLGKRVKILHSHDISLLGYHLPLDAHALYGNNAVIARKLALEDVNFVPISDMKNPIAAVGKLQSVVTAEEFANQADVALNTKGMMLDFSDSAIEKVFVLAGGGGGYFRDAANHGTDLLLTGELREDIVRAAEETGISIYAAGHYNREKLGILALGDHIREEYNVEVEFVDIPNPV